MATYYYGNNSELQGGGGDGLQTLILMNPGYVGYSETPGSNLVFLNTNHQGNNPFTLPHALPAQPQQLVGLPLPATLPLTTTATVTSSPVHSQHEVSTLHGFLPSARYNFYNPPGMDISLAREAPRTPQGLSLSLSPQETAFASFVPEREVPSSQPVAAMISPGEDVVKGSGGSSSSASGVSSGMHQSVLLSSKYLKAARELLDEVVRIGKGEKVVKNIKESSMAMSDGGGRGDGPNGNDACPKRATELMTTAEIQEVQMKKAKLVNMLDEVEQRYRQYQQHMQSVISWFEQAAGIGSAKAYTALALQTISKHFRCLKDAILGQIRAARKSLGEEETKTVQFRQQRALQQLGMVHHNAWRPQRGLPERSVSVLRAWLFEHFLHPYPKDSDKIMLAKQTGLTRSQVSNWFINARVRLWKPMVEEMYLEEIKEQEEKKNKKPKEDSTSMAAATTTPSQEKSPEIINAIASPEMESVTQGSPKKARGTEVVMMHSLSSVPSNNDSEHAVMSFSGGFRSYNMGELFPRGTYSSSGNSSVSLTLGLPHCENLSISEDHHRQGFLPSQSVIQLGRRVGLEANGFGRINTPTPANVYDSLGIQDRKGFVSQLLHDFVS